MFEEDEIRELAKAHGLGELVEVEMNYIQAKHQYELYAADRYIPGDVIDAKERTWRALFPAVTQERADAVNRFAGQLIFLAVGDDDE